MATRRQKENDAVASSRQLSTRSKRKMRSPRPPETVQEDSNSSQSSGASGKGIDILLEACYLLASKDNKKISKKNLDSMHVLGLEHIRLLQDKDLLRCFSHLESEELTKWHTRTCTLMPTKCSVTSKSYASEHGADTKMMRHLQDHVKALIVESEKPDRAEKFEFFAVPEHAKAGNLKSKSMKTSPPNVRKKKTEFTKIKEKSKPSSDASPENSLPSAPDAEASVTSPSSEVHKENTASRKRKKVFQDSGPPAKKGKPDSSKTGAPGKTLQEKNNFKNLKPRKKKSPETDSAKESRPQVDVHAPSSASCLHFEVHRHDHDYTYCDGKVSDFYNHSPGPEPVESKDPVAEPILALHLRVQNSQELPMVSCEVIIDPAKDKEGCSGGKRLPNVQNSHPPIKASTPRITKVSRKKKLSGAKILAQEGDKAVDETKKLAALRFLDTLRNRPKDEKVDLKCQICPEKVTFTAAASLMYHYRSHAGLKPFICDKCDKGFTRQHSLNYHLMIHNNQSRFKCPDCERSFRHPNHFKEHRRKHTGETPFMCSDCKQRFKTRNTYKRHLKTRHGRILTAKGITTLSDEEFQQVRTKPYRKFLCDYDVTKKPDSEKVIMKKRPRKHRSESDSTGESVPLPEIKPEV